jgi:hypothetical protein
MRVLLIGTGGVGTCLAVRASSRRTVSLGAAQAVPSLLLQRHQHGLAPTRLWLVSTDVVYEENRSGRLEMR